MHQGRPAPNYGTASTPKIQAICAVHIPVMRINSMNIRDNMARPNNRRYQQNPDEDDTETEIEFITDRSSAPVDLLRPHPTCSTEEWLAKRS
jgi:hypothetical protein